MRSILLAFAFLGMSFTTYAQTHFAAECQGEWTGFLHIYAGGQLRDSVEIIFTSAPTDTPEVYIWRTQYLSETHPMTKDYRLRMVNGAAGQYETDEGDGIVLKDYRFGNKLYSMFETGETYLTATYELVGDRLIFEVTSGKQLSQDAEVNNFSVGYVQRAVLTKRE
ncbi:hypothetical protein [Pontibacter sp. G13]|uniref:hypothetical protein n=1 Tax=Pontibacter sp. G13 TaxID=3074898 RepID=UPI002888FAC3|nr:hypothetical protein [Pontibacter sp. G13]WNJ20118.1 hypothetical protein RJD25_06505 [Pontibacter sp. G13]